jgi:hypothetical protein
LDPVVMVGQGKAKIVMGLGTRIEAHRKIQLA